MPFDMYIAIPSYMTYWLKTAIAMIEGGIAQKPEPVKFAVLAAEPLSDELQGHSSRASSRRSAPPTSR